MKISDIRKQQRYKALLAKIKTVDSPRTKNIFDAMMETISAMEAQILNLQEQINSKEEFKE